MTRQVSCIVPAPPCPVPNAGSSRLAWQVGAVVMRCASAALLIVRPTVTAVHIMMPINRYLTMSTPPDRRCGQHRATRAAADRA